MAIPTVNVLVSVYEQDGSPAAGAQVIAKLMTAERYNGFIVPDEYSGITDNNGNCTVSLFPNELGTEGSEYKFKIIHRNGKTVNLFATIPNADCNLHQVVELDRYELRGAGQIVTSEIIGYVNDAYIARDAAQLSESNAQNSADQAYTQANIATTQAAISTTKAGESANSATASLNSANNSASSANTALTYANNATTAKVAAEAARDLANTHKIDAQSARDKAQLWAEQNENVVVETGKYSAKHHAAKAAASATAASTSKDTATTKATEAAASVTTALGHANDAKAYRDTAATHAADALASKNAAAVSAGNASTSASTASTKAAEAVVSAGQALTYRDQCEDFYQGMVAEGLHSHNNKTILDATTASFTTAEKDKLATVALNANAYVHPASHPPSIITQDASNRFVTDTEKSTWNNKASTAVATTSVNGLMSSADKTKLDGVAVNANNYSHPTGDGNLHVPATGTSNAGKVLTAGATAGSLLWSAITQALSGMTDVTISSPASGEILKWNGSKWINNTLAEAGIAAATHTHSNYDEVPPGTVIFFAGATLPTGYLKANGATVSRTTYASLYSAIGTRYGSGDGSTTFKLPDLRGEFVRGWDDSRGVDSGRTLGTTQADAFESHTHNILAGTDQGDGGPKGRGADNNATSGTIVTEARGSTETRPRNIALMACIKY